MYGTAGRVGLIIFDSDLTIEPDMRRLLPDAVEIHTARVSYPNRVTQENLRLAAERAVAALAQLLPIRPSAIAWACTSGSFIGGKAAHELLLDQLRRAAGGVPVTTASGAVVAACRHLGIQRPAVGTPYSEQVTSELLAFLQEHDIMPVAVERLHANEMDDYALQDVSDVRLAGFLRQLVCAPEADGIVLSCTGLATATLPRALEPELGLPIVSSNLAIAWHCWRLGGISAPPLGGGALIQTLQTGVPT